MSCLAPVYVPNKELSIVDGHDLVAVGLPGLERQVRVSMPALMMRTSRGT